jgi:hypothetical protein
MMVDYTVRRGVRATKENGGEALIALVFIRHENGQPQTLCVDEEMIRFYGEKVIEDEVKRAVSLPSDVSLGDPLRLGDSKGIIKPS